jgi:pimeloyl-ACP methyl ester carboxylesterase
MGHVGSAACRPVIRATMAAVHEERTVRPDGRTVAWSESGVADGMPVLRVPGTPGSRFSLRADEAPWLARGLRVITVERPGFGASTRLPGRGFAEHADDLAAILDHLAIERLPVYGGSGAAPHVLAFAARHPERVAACSIISGAAPLTDDEVHEQVEFNAIGDGLARARDVDRLTAVLGEARASILADPVAGYRAMMDTAPPDDQEIMSDPAWQAVMARGVMEALAPGVDGWVDELLAIDGDWPDIDVSAVASSVTWWHSDADRNCPFSAAQRLVDRLRVARLIVWETGGHLTAYRREPEILDELLSRAGPSLAGTRGAVRTPAAHA